MISQRKKHVCVIGAGASGLVAARYLLAKPEHFLTTVIEQSGRVGGTWVYTDLVGKDDYGNSVFSSMYKNLRSNLPKELMSFPDFPFWKGKPSFITHKEVCQYLQNFAEHFNILKCIKFKKRVLEIHNHDAGCFTWRIIYEDVKTKEIEQIFSDAIMVCNGHFSIPDIPVISGIARFKGSILHSHDYREPSAFWRRNVVLLGAGHSGLDIGLEVSLVANKVYISHNGSRPIKSELPSNMHEKVLVLEATENGFRFEDGSFCQADVIIYCTGYKYDFSFLSACCHLNVNNRRVIPLYRHLIHIEFPSLCLIGILHMFLPFPILDRQVRYFIASLDGTMKLPSKEEMIEHSKNDFTQRLKEGLPCRYAHFLGDRMWSYMEELADLAGFEHLPEYIRPLYEYVAKERNDNLQTYKNTNYEIVGSSFMIIND